MQITAKEIDLKNLKTQITTVKIAIFQFFFSIWNYNN